MLGETDLGLGKVNEGNRDRIRGYLDSPSVKKHITYREYNPSDDIYTYEFKVTPLSESRDSEARKKAIQGLMGLVTEIITGE